MWHLTSYSPASDNAARQAQVLRTNGGPVPVDKNFGELRIFESLKKQPEINHVQDTAASMKNAKQSIHIKLLFIATNNQE